MPNSPQNDGRPQPRRENLQRGVHAPLTLGRIVKQPVRLSKVTQDGRMKAHTGAAKVGSTCAMRGIAAVAVHSAHFFAGGGVATAAARATAAAHFFPIVPAACADVVVCVHVNSVGMHGNGPQQHFQSRFRVALGREKPSAPRKQLAVHGGDAWPRRHRRHCLQSVAIKNERSLRVTTRVVARCLDRCAHHMLNAVGGSGPHPASGCSEPSGREA